VGEELGVVPQRAAAMDNFGRLAGPGWLHEITSADRDRFASARLAEVGAAASVDTDLRVLRAVFNVAEEWRHLPEGRNPLRRCAARPPWGPGGSARRAASRRPTRRRTSTTPSTRSRRSWPWPPGRPPRRPTRRTAGRSAGCWRLVSFAAYNRLPLRRGGASGVAGYRLGERRRLPLLQGRERPEDGGVAGPLRRARPAGRGAARLAEGRDLLVGLPQQQAEALEDGQRRLPPLRPRCRPWASGPG